MSGGGKHTGIGIVIGNLIEHEQVTKISGAQSMAYEIPVLYGTETGNAEYCADILADRLRDEGFTAKSIDMEDFDPASLPSERMVVVITSTYGNGDAPSNAEELLEHLQTEDINLSHLRFAVCGLGDTSFTHFAQCGKDFEKALLRCQAKPMFDRVDCDAHFEPDFEAFTETTVAFVVNNKSIIEGEPQGAEVQASSVSTETQKAWSRERPFASSVVEKRLLSKAGSGKETMHYEFDLSGSGIEFHVGDCLGVNPVNRQVDINAVVEALDAAGTEKVVWQQQECSLTEALEHACLQQVTGALVGYLAALDGSRSGAAARAVAQGDEAVAAYVESVHVVDALRDNPTEALEISAFLKSLRKLQPRLFSVASSPSRAPEQVGFTIETLRYQWRDREVHGVASCWLADRIEVGDKVGVYPVKNQSFHFPYDERPVIMLGPGTGIAPFRGYLDELETTGSQNPTWLFFGHQHRAYDYLYGDEIERWLESGVLDRADFAWSRDQDHKVYVQDRLLDQAAEVWSWMERGALVYVCGDAMGMAPAVADAFVQIAQTQGGHTDGKAWLDALIDEGRYKTDVY